MPILIKVQDESLRVQEVWNLLDTLDLKGSKISEIAGEGINEILVLHTNTNVDYIIKLMTRKPLDDFEQQRFVREKELLNKISQDVNVPTIVYADAETRHIGAKTIYGVMVMERLNAIPLYGIVHSLDTQRREEVYEALLNIAKKIHRYKKSDFSTLPNLRHLTERTWGQRMERIYNEAFQTLEHKKILSDDAYNELVRMLEYFEIMVKSIKEERLIHNDYWTGNVLVENPKDLSSMYIIDWEWASFGNPFADVYELNTDLLDLEKAEEKTQEIYKEVMPDNPSLHRLMLSMVFSIESLAFGYLFHNDTRENRAILKKRLENGIDSLKSFLY